ncbi:MAG: hypothetical protein ACE5DI_06225 [Candidatus Micrarchaeia archaeon]
MADFDDFGQQEDVEEEQSFSEGARDVSASAAGAVKRFGVGKIIAILLLLLIVYAFFELPKPVNVEVRVVARDFGEPVVGVSGTAFFSDFFGSKTVTGVETDLGVLKFKGIPTKTDVRFSFRAGGFKDASKTFTFKSAGSRSEELARKTDLVFSSNPASSSIGQRCSMNLFAEVSNPSEEDLEAELVSDFGGFTALSGRVTVPARDKVVYNFSISSHSAQKGDELSGEVRVKGTAESFDLSFVVSESPRIDFQSDIRFTEREPKVVVTISNRGDSEVFNVKVVPQESAKGKVNILPFVGRSLKKGSDLKVLIENTGFSSESDKGLIDVYADCVPRRQIEVSYS